MDIPFWKGPEVGIIRAAHYLAKINPSRYKWKNVFSMDGMLHWFSLTDTVEEKELVPQTLISTPSNLRYKIPDLIPEADWKQDLLNADWRIRPWNLSLLRKT
jgi:hypothetical protein